MINAAMAFSLPSFVLGVALSEQLSIGALVVAAVGGFAIVSVIAALVGTIGARTHLNSYLLVRIAFGLRGSMFVNAAFALSMLGWFGVNIDIFGSAISYLLNETFAFNVEISLIEVTAGVLMTATSIIGFKAIRFLSTIFVPIIASATVWMAATLVTGSADGGLFDPGNFEFAFSGIGSAVSSVVGGLTIAAITMPDITRFIRSWPGAVKAALLSYLGLSSVVVIVAGLAAEVSGSKDVLEMLLQLGLGFVAFAIVVIGTWIMNAFNLYGCSLGFAAAFPKLYGTRAIALFGVLGILAATLNILDNFLSYLFYLAIAFVPVAGVIIVDFLLIRRDSYVSTSESNLTRVNKPALVSWAVAFVICLVTAETSVNLSGVPALDAVMISGVCYWILCSGLGRSQRQPDDLSNRGDFAHERST